MGFASDDPFVSQGEIDALPGIMQATGVDYAVEIYTETEHGFVFLERAVYKKHAAARPWETMVPLFYRRLRSKT